MMSHIEQYNSDFGIEGQVTFKDGQGDMPIVEVNNTLACASIALQGAHVLHYQAVAQSPLIWMSPEVTYAEGKSLRGGVPVCWPWFGPHAVDKALPGHGFARTVNWKPVASAALADGSTQISFELVATAASKAACPHALRVRLHMTVGSSLKLMLETSNLGKTTFTLGAALHTYLQVGDVRQVRLEGLDACDYLDKVDGGVRKSQQGDVLFTQETDRIYLNTGSVCTLVDPSMDRKIVMHSQGSASTVVWNPWLETANKMGDLGEEGYLNMLCVEVANAAEDVVLLAAGATHRMQISYTVETL
ncbi:MAG: D-hexose-6-phosphate mutarotase [Mariprofundaceae bacterium]|nr:D-hexose-6-phosphate mutarotase [Mariprofundaceae bacterium]